ncbi:papain-like cysteine protease family protein [Streptomyces barringtoniae]|uniref:papain-like cysteine protease family protein n=1 Tax=Streptomyces barringtoniae TaxID=2892029 RepID=UPI001E31B27E|nr:papain-like cysteine protease family protein [Streptomyces barringtoniae]MCC5478377.1 C39 family peptidase [Streptomyces barringtoniae]
MSITTRGRRRLASAVLAAVAVLTPVLVPTATAHAAPVSAADTARRAAPHPAVPTAKRLNITMQAQQNSNWCWAASGNTIASWFGRDYTQNQFCDAAFNRPQGSTCGNWQAALDDVQNALDWMGINPGTYVSGYLRYNTVQKEINADRPIETRIEWSSGGGHMHVLYGYDTSDSQVYWGDPWPSNYRYNWGDYDYYVNNNSFTWTHSLYGIGA